LIALLARTGCAFTATTREWNGTPARIPVQVVTATVGTRPVSITKNPGNTRPGQESVPAMVAISNGTESTRHTSDPQRRPSSWVHDNRGTAASAASAGGIGPL